MLFDLAFAVVCSAVLMSGSLTVSADEADTAPHDDGAAEAPFGWHEERERSHGRQLWASGLVLRFWDPSGRPPSAPPSPGAVDLGDFRQVRSPPISPSISPSISPPAPISHPRSPWSP